MHSGSPTTLTPTDRQRPDVSADTRHTTRLQLACGTTALVILAALGLLIVRPHLAGPETALLNRFVTAGPDWLGSLAVVLSAVFAPFGAVVIACLVGLAVMLGGGLVKALHYWWVVGVVVLVATAVKFVVHRPRPDANLLVVARAPETGSLSFPSGHTVFATVLVLALAFVVTTRTRRVLVVALACVAGITMGFTRLYVGAHFPSDVLASYVCVAAGTAIAQAGWSRFVGPLVTTLHEHDKCGMARAS
ncbi:phosphatase PAP2 family protein [Propionibacterium sp.]|uniref:phosphatase PAP2 family protein n=1 Tax=Propionibacterium sp. TaxID=1977903 RepID=UPI0039EB9569